jgi:hypothetical protein
MLDLKMYRMFAFENRHIETYIGNMACQQVRGVGIHRTQIAQLIYTSSIPNGKQNIHLQEHM